MSESNRGSRKRRYLWAGLAILVVVGAAALGRASVPHSFNTGDTLQAADLNSNFTALDQRLTALESLVPSGSIVAYGGPAATSADGGAPAIPTGWLLCDGSAVSRTTYAALFAAVGINFGGGDGVNTFNLPDLRGRTVIGAGHGATLTARTLGQTLGEETHTLSASEMPSHTHPIGPQSGINQNGQVFVQGGGSCGLDCTSADYLVVIGALATGATGGGVAHNVMQPSAVLNYIIHY